VQLAGRTGRTNGVGIKLAWASDTCPQGYKRLRCANRGHCHQVDLPQSASLWRPWPVCLWNRLGIDVMTTVGYGDEWRDCKPGDAEHWKPEGVLFWTKNCPKGISQQTFKNTFTQQVSKLSVWLRRIIITGKQMKVKMQSCRGEPTPYTDPGHGHHFLLQYHSFFLQISAPSCMAFSIAVMDSD